MDLGVENQLKELILDDDFSRLQGLTNKEVNLMEILKVSHKELQHSNFLAWLLSPQETHNLGDFAFKEFIKIYFKENEFQDLGDEKALSVFDFVQLDFDDLVIKREYKNIDLIFLSKKNEFCMVVENKIYSSEGNGQLTKYRNFAEKEYSDYKYRIYIYLSLEEQKLSQLGNQYYVQITYEHVIKLLNQLLTSEQINLAEQTRFVLEQYLKTLKSMLNQNEEIEIITKKLYQKYKSAFDLVFKYCAETESSLINNIHHELIDKDESLTSFRSSKSYVRFQPNFLYSNYDKLIEKSLFPTNGVLENDTIYLFEFNIKSDCINFDLKIGDGDQNVRKNILEIYQRHPRFFGKVNKKFSSKWHLSFQKQILSSEDYENL